MLFSFDLKERQLRFWWIWFWLCSLWTVCLFAEQQMPSGKKRVFFCIRYISKLKQSPAEKNTEHYLTHLNKTTLEIWDFFNKVHFWPKFLTPFFHQAFQLYILVYTLHTYHMQNLGAINLNLVGYMYIYALSGITVFTQPLLEQSFKL